MLNLKTVYYDLNNYNIKGFLAEPREKESIHWFIDSGDNRMNDYDNFH